MKGASSRDGRDGAVERGGGVVAVGLVGVAAVTLAGVPATVHVGLAVIAVVALAGVGLQRVRRRRRLRLPLLTAPLVAGAAFTAVSLVPLPAPLRALLAPEGLDRATRAAALLAADAAATVKPVLSFDPPESALALVRLVFAIAVATLVAHAARERPDRRVLWRAILVVAFVTGFALLFAQAIGIPRWLDVVGVPVNGNHRARLAGALALLCGMRAATTRARIELTWFSLAAALHALLLFGTLSKGGIVAFVGGVAVAAVIVARGAKARSNTAVAAAVVAVVGVVLVAGGVYVGGDVIDRLVGELHQPARLKTFLWEPATRVALIEPFVGVGNNAFGVVFPSVLSAGELDATLTYTHPENLLLQTFADHGVVGGLVIVVVALAAAIGGVRGLRTASELAPVPALLFLLAGDIFDFVLETPMGLGLLALCLGLLAARTPERGLALSGVRVSLAVALCALAVIVPAPLAVSQWRYAVDDSVDDAGLRRRAVLEAALAAHPSDAGYAAALAVDARHQRDPQRALRFANRALVLWPALEAAHREAARAFFAVGNARQGLLEYREAWRSGGNVIREVTRRTNVAALRLSTVPTPWRAANLARMCRVFVEEKRVYDARACYDDVLALDDVRDDDRRVAVALALAADDAADAVAIAETFVDAADGDNAAARARALDALTPTTALAETSVWLSTVRDPAPLLQWRLNAQRARGDLVGAEATLRALLRLNTTSKERGRLEVALFEVLRARGDTVAALESLEHALRARPRDLELLLSKMRLELASGDIATASATLARMRLISPNDRRVRAAEAALDAHEQK